MSYLIYQILKLKAFLIGTGLAGIILMTVFLLWAVRPKRGLSHYRWQALFFQRTIPEILYLSGAMLQLIFVISGSLGQVKIERIHLYLLVSIWLLKSVTVPGVRSILLDACYSILTAGVFLTCNLLAGFMAQTGRDIWILSMYGLLYLFLTELAVYDFLSCLRHLTEERRPRRSRDRGEKKRMQGRMQEETDAE